MTHSIEFLGSFFGILGAAYMAFFPARAFQAYLILFPSGLFLSVYAYLTDAPSLFTLQVVYTVINLLGLFKRFPARFRVPKASS